MKQAIETIKWIKTYAEYALDYIDPEETEENKKSIIENVLGLIFTEIIEYNHNKMKD